MAWGVTDHTIVLDERNVHMHHHLVFHSLEQLPQHGVRHLEPQQRVTFLRASFASAHSDLFRLGAQRPRSVFPLLYTINNDATSVVRASPGSGLKSQTLRMVGVRKRAPCDSSRSRAPRPEAP